MFSCNLQFALIFILKSKRYTNKLTATKLYRIFHCIILLFL